MFSYSPWLLTTIGYDNNEINHFLGLYQTPFVNKLLWEMQGQCVLFPFELHHTSLNSYTFAETHKATWKISETFQPNK